MTSSMAEMPSSAAPHASSTERNQKSSAIWGVATGRRCVALVVSEVRARVHRHRGLEMIRVFRLRSLEGTLRNRFGLLRKAIGPLPKHLARARHKSAPSRRTLSPRHRSTRVRARNLRSSCSTSLTVANVENPGAAPMSCPGGSTRASPPTRAAEQAMRKPGCLPRRVRGAGASKRVGATRVRAVWACRARARRSAAAGSRPRRTLRPPGANPCQSTKPPAREADLNSFFAADRLRHTVC